MKGLLILGAIGLCLAGCQKATSGQTAGAPHQGRYIGVGVYPSGQMWQRLADAAIPKDAAVSRVADDEQVIVVVDSQSGEVRQCGNLSGYCIGMNPWTGPLDPQHTAPVSVTAHAGQALKAAPAAP